MDHSIEELDNCIFDFLVSKPNQWFGIDEIYESITCESESGHRCQALKNNKHNGTYIASYKQIAITLNNKFTNIRSKIRTFDNVLCLIFDEKNTYSKQFWPHEYVSDYKMRDTIKSDWSFDANDILNYMDHGIDYNDEINSKHVTDITYDNTNSYIHLLVINNKIDKLDKLMKIYVLDLDIRNKWNLTPLDIAIKNNNCRMVKLILDYKYGNTIQNLRYEINNFKQEKPIFGKHKQVRTIQRFKTKCDNMAKIIGYMVEGLVGLCIGYYLLM
jgi:hypothetical protein